MGFPAPATPQSIFFEVDSFVGATCYSDANTSNILGDSAKEDALIAFIVANAIPRNQNFLYLYGLSALIVGSAFTAPAKTNLNLFYQKCFTNGITPVAVFRQNQAYLDAVLDYYATTGHAIGYALKEPWWLNNSFNVDGAYKCFTNVKAFLAANYVALNAVIGLGIFVGNSHMNGFAYPDATVVSGGDEITQIARYVNSDTGASQLIVTGFNPNSIPSYADFKQRIRSASDVAPFADSTNIMFHISLETTVLNTTCAPDATHNFSGYYLKGQNAVTGGPVIYPTKSIYDVYKMIVEAFDIPPAQIGSPLYLNAETYSNIITAQRIGFLGIGFTDYSLAVALPQPIVVEGVVTKPCFHSPSGAIVIDVSGGSGIYTYLWSNGATTKDISALVPGVYYVSVSDGTQTVSYSFVVGENTPIAVSLAYATHQLASTVSGGTAPYTYLWSDASTGAVINNPAPGNYALTVTDAIGCKTTVETTILTDDQCVILKGKCCAGNLGYQYVWQAKNGLIKEANLSVIQLGLLQGFIEDICEYVEEGCLSAVDKENTIQKIQLLCRCCGCEENDDVLNP